jgi:hypothetical protein
VIGLLGDAMIGSAPGPFPSRVADERRVEVWRFGRRSP